MKLTSYAIAISLSISATAYAGLLVKDEITREQNRISENFRLDRQVCASRSGNAKAICLAEAKANEKVALADLEARDKGTAKARQDALIVRAETGYDVAKQRCEDFAGNAKDVCRTDAQAALTKAKADATLERKTVDANNSAADAVLAAQTQASNVKREADYKAARERCNSLAGNARDSCVNDAKSRFGMM